LKKELPVGLEEINQANMVQRESGDQINRFLLFALVSNSAKRIKARAANKGVDLPMTLITRSVLRSYRAAAKVKNGPFATSTPDPQQLEELNKEIFLNLISQWKKALRPPAKPR
jgi:hypothetical protein